MRTRSVNDAIDAPLESRGFALQKYLVHSLFVVPTLKFYARLRRRWFLKVSLEELLIALRDDRHLLHDPDGMFAQNTTADQAALQSLYPQGFSAGSLIEVVETQVVWQGI